MSVPGYRPEPNERDTEKLARGIRNLYESVDALADVAFVTTITTATIANERALTAGTGITLTDGGAGSTLTIAATASSAFKQLVTATKLDTFSSATTAAWTDITGLSITITPQLSSTTILLLALIGQAANSSTPYIGFRWATSGGTPLQVGTAAGSRIQTLLSIWGSVANNIAGAPLLLASHAPGSTSAQTYKGQFIASAGTTFINRDGADTDSAAFHRSACVMAAIEVA